MDFEHRYLALAVVAVIAIVIFLMSSLAPRGGEKAKPAANQITATPYENGGAELAEDNGSEEGAEPSEDEEDAINDIFDEPPEDLTPPPMPQ